MSHAVLLFVTVVLCESTPALTLSSALTQSVNSRVSAQHTRAWTPAGPEEVFSTDRRTETHSQDDVLMSTPRITHSAHSGRSQHTKAFTLPG